MFLPLFGTKGPQGPPGIAKAVADTLSLSEALTPVLDAVLRRTVTDTLSLSDAVAVDFIGTFQNALADTLTLTEAVTVDLISTEQSLVADTLSLSDAVTALLDALPPLELPLTETWTVADATGTLNGDWPWSDFIGTQQWRVAAGRARLALTSGGMANQGGRLMIAVPTDVTVTLPIRTWTMAGPGAWLGVLARLPGDFLVGYETLLLQTGTGGSAVYSLHLFRFSGGGQVALVSSVATPAPVSGSTIGVRVEGQQITALRDGLPILTTTDPVASGGLDTGNYIGFLGGAQIGDVLEVDDLVVAVAGAPGLPKATADSLGFTELATAVLAVPDNLPQVETWTVGDTVADASGDHAWDDFIGTERWHVATGGLRLLGPTGVTQGASLLRDLGVHDYRVSVRVRDWSPVNPGSLSAGLVVRMPGGQVFTGYSFVAQALNGVGRFTLYKFVNGAQAELASVMGSPATGMVLTVRVQGPQLSCFVEGVATLTHTDTGAFLGPPILTGRFVGVQGFIG